MSREKLHAISDAVQLNWRIVAGFAKDILQQRDGRQERDLCIAALQKRLARDELTGAYTRTYLEDRKGEFWKPDNQAHTGRRQHDVIDLTASLHHSVLALDIDHFKDINDTYGHAAGDQILREFTHTIAGQLRSDDFVVRTGGEEFLVVLPDTGLQSAETVAEKLRLATADTMDVTFSGGIATILPGESCDQTLARADAALYEAKQAGRNQIAIAS